MKPSGLNPLVLYGLLAGMNLGPAYSQPERIPQTEEQKQAMLSRAQEKRERRRNKLAVSQELKWRGE